MKLIFATYKSLPEYIDTLNTGISVFSIIGYTLGMACAILVILYVMKDIIMDISMALFKDRVSYYIVSSILLIFTIIASISSASKSKK